LTIHQDATISAGLFAAGESATHVIADTRYAWVQVAKGAIEVAGEQLKAGDALAAEGPGELAIVGTADAEILVFDLA